MSAKKDNMSNTKDLPSTIVVASSSSELTFPITQHQVVVQYSKLVVPLSMRSIYWKFFGFPANDNGDIVSRQRIICILCKTQISYNKNTSNLRMHLQNRHPRELSKIESKSHARVSKAKMARTASILNAEAEANSAAEEYYIEGSDEVLTVAGEDESENSVVRKVIVQNADISSSSMLNMIAGYIVSDLEPPDVVDGRGFQRLLVNIKSPCSLPSRQMLTTEIIPKMYYDVKAAALEEVTNITGDMGMAIEEWTCARDRLHLSICVYYHNAQHEVEWKMLSTIAFIASMDTIQWQQIITNLFTEWNIIPDKVTAVVCSTDREAILNAFCNKGFTLIPCLDFTINECVRQCFHNDVISEILVKVREVIILVKSHPATSDTILAHSSTPEYGDYKLSLDVEYVWLSTLNMLESFLHWRDVIQKLLCLIGNPFKTALELGEDEWCIIMDLIDALQPFKMTLTSLSEEKVPLISLIKPILWQVINKKLCIGNGDSVTLQNVKKATVDLLTYRYQDERLTPLLDMATFVDPRFKLPGHLSEEDKSSISEMVLDLLQKIIVLESSDEENEGKTMSSMELLLGQPKTKVEKMGTEEMAHFEYQQYLSFPPAVLDSCPILWWWRQRDKYPRLGLLADKYLCVPAVATLPGKRTLESMISFHTRRSTLPDELLDENEEIYSAISPTTLPEVGPEKTKERDIKWRTGFDDVEDLKY